MFLSKFYNIYIENLLPIDRTLSYHPWNDMTYHEIVVIQIKNIIFVAKTQNYGIFSRTFMITRFSIAFQDLLVSSIALQVFPPWPIVQFFLANHEKRSQTQVNPSLMRRTFCHSTGCPRKKSTIIFFGAGDGIPRKNFIGDFFLGHPVSFCIFVIPSIFLSVFMSFRLSDFLSNFLSFCRSCFGHLSSYKFIFQLH